jgi:triphosphoribosyl-dephospho-CoA synthetase
MEFTRHRPTLGLVEDTGHEHVCFGADLFEGRPSFKKIEAFQDWAQQQKESLEKLRDRKVCPVKWLGLYVDQEGAWMIACRKSGQTLNNTRQCLKTLLSALPADLQEAVSKSLRPLDELDKVRIDGWQTVNDLRGDSEADSDEDSQETTLALRQAGQIELDLEGGALVAWAARAQAYATICLASTGDMPELTYIRCSEKKQRRHLLLLAKVREEKAESARASQGLLLADVARIAAALAKDGSLPAPGRQRNCEFLRRCVEALKVVNPKAETEVSNLPKEEQAAVRRALGDEVESYQGCLSEGCLDEESVWETDDLGDGLQLSRCARCRFPKAMGRTIASPLDLIRESLKRGRGTTFAREEERLRNVRRRTE